ncbi:hypothetical protein ABPG74_001427 [Tetrahymena malaccensis]
MRVIYILQVKFFQRLIIFEILINLTKSIQQENTCSISSLQGYQTSSYESLVNSQCIQCHTECLACFGPYSYNCQACVDPNKSLFNNQCLDKCPPGYYSNKKSKKCQKCGNNCMECINENTCTKCYSNFQLKTQYVSELDITILDLTDNNFSFQQSKQSQNVICTSRCNNGLLFDNNSQSCVRVCPNFTQENQDTQTCDNLSPCSTIQDLNQVYHEAYVWGIIFDPQTGYFISYDQNGVILIWIQNSILIKKLTYHKFMIAGLSIIQINQSIEQPQIQQSNLNQNYRYLVSYDESVLALWDLKQFNLLKSINLQNNFKTNNFKSFVFDQYFVGLNQQGYYQRISLLTDYDNTVVFNITDLGSNTMYVSFQYTNQKQFLYDPYQLKVKQVDSSLQLQPIFNCQKYPNYVRSLYYESSINAVFLFGYQGINVIFLDNNQITNTCFLDNFPANDEGLNHLITLDITKMMVSYVNFQSIDIDENGNLQQNNSLNIDQLKNGIIEFIVMDQQDRIWKYQMDCIKQTITRMNKDQIDSNFQDNFWNQNEIIIQSANRYVVKDTYIFTLLNSKKLIQLNSSLKIINSNFTVNPLNLYNVVRIKDWIITYDIQMDIYNLNGKLQFVIQSIINSVKNSQQIYNYLQQQPNGSLTNPIYINDYALNLQGQFLQLWQLPSYKLINQVLLPYDSSDLLPYYYIIQNDKSQWNNCIILSYQFGSYFYKYPTLEQIIYHDMTSIYSIQTQNNILICSSDNVIYIFDISQNIQLIQQLNLQQQLSSTRAILYNQYVIFQDANQDLLIYDINSNTQTPFKNYKQPLINQTSNQIYSELTQVCILSNKLISLNSLNYLSTFDLDILTMTSQISPSNLILYLFSMDPYYILILDNGHIQFYNVDNLIIQDFNQFDNYIIFYALMQDEYLIFKSSNQILAILDCKQIKLLVSFYEASSQIQYIFYDYLKELLVLNRLQGGLSILDCYGNQINTINNSISFQSIKVVLDLNIIIAIDTQSVVYKIKYPPVEYLLIQSNLHQSSITQFYLDQKYNIFLSLSADTNPQNIFYAQTYLQNKIIQNSLQTEAHFLAFYILKDENQILFVDSLNQLNFYSYPDFKLIQILQIPQDNVIQQVYINKKNQYALITDFLGQITIVSYPKLNVTYIDYLISNDIQISSSVDFQYSDEFFIFIDMDSILYIFNSTNFQLMKKFLVHDIFDIAIILDNSILMSYNLYNQIIFQTLPDLNLQSILTNTNIIQFGQYVVDNKFKILFQVIAPGKVIAIDLNSFQTLTYYSCIFGYITYLQIDSENQHLLFSSTSIFIYEYNGEIINTLNHDSEVTQFIIDQECQIIISYTVQGFIYIWDYQNGKLIITLNFQPDSISLIYLDSIFNVIIIGHFSGAIRYLDYEYIISSYLENKYSQITGSFSQYFTVLGQNIVYYDSRSNYIISPLQSEQNGLYVIENIGMIGVSQINNQLFSNSYKNQLYFKQNQKLNIYSFQNNTQNGSAGNQIQVDDTFYVKINQQNIKNIFLFTQQERFYYNKDSGEIVELIINFKNKTQQENTLLQNNFFSDQALIKMSVYENYNLSQITLLIQTQISITLFYINNTSNQQIQNYQRYNLTYFFNSQIVNIQLYSEEYYKYSNQKQICDALTNPCYKYLAILANTSENGIDQINQILLYDLQRKQSISLNSYTQDIQIDKIIIYQNIFMFVFRNYRGVDVYTLQNIKTLQKQQQNSNQLISLSIVRQLATPSNQNTKLRICTSYLFIFNSFQLNIFTMNDLLFYWKFKNQQYSYIQNLYTVTQTLCILEDKYHILILDLANKLILKGINMFQDLSILSFSTQTFSIQQKDTKSTPLMFSQPNSQSNKQLIVNLNFYDKQSIHQAILSTQSTDNQSCMVQTTPSKFSQYPLIFENQLQQIYTQNQQFNINQQTLLLYYQNLMFLSPFIGSPDIITNLIVSYQNLTNLNSVTLYDRILHSQDQIQPKENTKRILFSIDFDDDTTPWPAQNENCTIKDLAPYGNYYLNFTSSYLSLYVNILFFQNYQIIVANNLQWGVNIDTSITQQNRTKKMYMNRALINQGIKNSSALIANLDNCIIVDFILDGNNKNYKIYILPNISLFTYKSITDLIIEKLVIQNYHFYASNYLYFFYNVNQLRIHKFILRNNTFHIQKLSDMQALFQFSLCSNVTIDSIQIYQNQIEYYDDNTFGYANNQQNSQQKQQSQQQKQEFPIYLFFFNATTQINLKNISFYKNTGLQLIYSFNRLLLNMDQQLFELKNIMIKISDAAIIQNQFYYTPIVIQNANQTQLTNLNVSLNKFPPDCRKYLLESFDYLIQNNINSTQIPDEMKIAAISCFFPQNIIFTQNTNLFLVDSLFIENETYYSLLNIFESQFKLERSKFVSNINYRDSGGAITLQYCLSSEQIVQGLNLTKSNNENIFFSNQLIFNFDDIKGIQQSQQNIQNIITECMIQNNTAPFYGGAINSIYSDFQINSTNITKNNAAVGGAIFYNYYLPMAVVQYHQKRLNILNSLEQQQSSSQQQKNISLQANVIKDNKGLFYGKNVGSYPIGLKLKYQEREFNGYASGQPLKNYLQISFIDEEDNVVNALNQSTLPLGINQVLLMTQLFKIEIGTIANSNLLIDGNLIQEFGLYSPVTSSFQFNLTFIGIPNNQTQFYIRSLIIPQSNYILNNFQLSENYQQFTSQMLIKYVSIKFRKCKRGEVYVIRGDQIECLPCPQGKYSLKVLDTLNETASCQNCPIGAHFCVQDSIILKDGYWRENFFTDQILYCENSPQNCVSETKNNNKVDPYCSPGYRGPLCESCDYFNFQGHGYFTRSSKYECQKCLSMVKQKFKEGNLIIIFNNQIKPLQTLLYCLKTLCMICYIGFTLHKLLYQQYQAKIFYILKKMRIIFLNKSIKRDQTSFYSKVLIDFFQVLSFLNTFKLHQFLIQNIQEGLGNPVQSLYYPYNCIHSKINNNFMLEFKLIQSIVMPFFFIALIMIISTVLKYFFIRSISLQHHCINLILLIYFFMFPSTLQTMLSILSCRLIGQKLYILSDVQFECLTNSHKTLIYTYIIPSLIIWVLIAPLVIILKIRSHIKNINQGKNLRTRNIYDFIYSEYRQHKYYWEFVKLFKKALIIVILNYFDQYAVIQGILMSIIVFSYIVMVQNMKPHSNQNLNNLDLENNIIILICLQICIFYNQISYPQLNFILALIIYSLIIIFVMKLCFLITWTMIVSNTKVLNFYLFFVKKWNKNAPKQLQIANQITNVQRVQQNWKKIYKLFSQSIDEKKKGELTTFQVIRMMLYRKIDLASEQSNQEASLCNLQNQQQKLYNLKNIKLRSIKRLSQKEDFSLLSPSKLQSFQINKSIDDSPYLNCNYGDSPLSFQGQTQKVKKSQKFNNIFLQRSSLNASPTSIFNNNHEIQEKFQTNNLLLIQNSFNSAGDLNFKQKKDSTKITKMQTTDSRLEMQNLSQFSIQFVEDSTIVPHNQEDTRNNSLNYDILVKQSFSKICNKKNPNFSVSDSFSPIKQKE